MIAASGITMRYGKKTLFENVSIKFRPGNRYGLIGANGAGKSTFMKIMTGQIEQSAGEISIDQGCSLGYLRQDHYEFESKSIMDTVCMGNEALWTLHLEREDLYSKTDLNDHENERMMVIEEEYGDAGGYELEPKAARLLVGLGFPESEHGKEMGTLQGGWKLRVLLAQVLFGAPDILLLDEPTNHLDLDSIAWLESFLNRYEGTVVVISHDRHFLNEVCTHTADLDFQEIRMFTGNYDDFMITNEMLLEKSRKTNAQKEKRINELNHFISRFSANASKSKQATARKKELAKIEVDRMRPSSRVFPYIVFEPLERLGDKVIEAEGISKTYDGVTLFENLNLNIGNGEKVAIIGTNGVGKTTLLNLLLQRLKPDSGGVEFGKTVKVGYFPQDSGELINTDEPAVDWLSKYAPEDGIDETELRKHMGRMLFKGESALKPVNVLSGGERARLILSGMLLSGGNVLVLDEPTNHLDLESIESLNQALANCEDMTVLFVSHDREFLSSVATRVIEIADGKVTDYPGGYSDFEAWKKDKIKAAKAKASV